MGWNKSFHENHPRYISCKWLINLNRKTSYVNEDFAGRGACRAFGQSRAPWHHSCPPITTKRAKNSITAWSRPRSKEKDFSLDLDLGNIIRLIRSHFISLRYFFTINYEWTLWSNTRRHRHSIWCNKRPRNREKWARVTAKKRLKLGQGYFTRNTKSCRQER